MTRYTDLSAGQQKLPEGDPRTLATKEERIAAAQAEQAAFELQTRPATIRVHASPEMLAAVRAASRSGDCAWSRHILCLHPDDCGCPCHKGRS